MSRSLWRPSVVAALATALAGARVGAQQAVIVSGHITSGGAALSGVRVAIDELKIERTTDGEGRYSFVVPSSAVRGQRVKITASLRNRRGVYVPKTATIQLVGRPVTQDFDLALALDEQVVAERDTTRPAATTTAAPRVQATFGLGDSVSADRLDGRVDIADAAVGRVAGLVVAPATRVGGSSLITFRGPRSFLMPSQPLVIVDGIPVDNTVFTSTSQRFGRGGFDYGSALSDLDVGAVASVKVLSAGAASVRYGSLGANGVIDVTTRTVEGGERFAVSAAQQFENISVVRLPDFQNSYGQGLNGKFEFFNGRGGGINDSVAQSWGPALDGSAVSQASYTTPAQADVRLWTARPDNVSRYFDSGRTTNTTAGVQGQNDLGSFRASLGYRDTKGTTPLDALTRTSLGLRGRLHVNPRLELGISAFGSESNRDNAPGTGFTTSNPVFAFTQMGRQVDTDSLRVHLRDASGAQINWIYTGQNNPFFSTLVNNNYSHRYQTAGEATATYTLKPGMTATATSGVDHVRDGRLFNIAPGWQGGFPFYASSGDFSKGGSEGDEIASNRTRSSARFDAVRAASKDLAWNLGAGADVTMSNNRVRSLGVDSAVNVPSAGAPDTAKLPPVSLWSAQSRTSSVFGQGGVSFANGVSVIAALRNAWSSIASGEQSSNLLPAVHANLDLRQMVSSLQQSRSFTTMAVRGDWWKDASDLQPYAIATMYAGRPVSGGAGPSGSSLLIADSTLTPEITTGWQLGGDVGFRFLALGLGLTYYHEETDGVILPIPNPALQTLLAHNAGVISNQGIEASVSAHTGGGELGLGWDGAFNIARNENQVERLAGAGSSLALGPSFMGLSVQARPGQPLGVLVGFRQLRDASTGSPILRNGLPLPDSVGGPVVLGIAQPRFTFGLHNAVHYGWVSISASADGHVGGSLFSATNLSGSSSGTLASTEFRPDSGLLIVGIDATTRQANTRHVSTQDYFHALGRIQEPWVYSASYWKLRDLRLSFDFRPNYRVVPFDRVQVSIVGRNLYMWAKVPNVDPEAIDSPYAPRGVEFGQLPSAKTVGFQLTILP
jgi:hypothetical protein